MTDEMEKKRILAVDDEMDFLRITKLNLEATGRYEVAIMPDAAGILAQVDSFKPDLILLDILMPNIDGVEVCAALKDDPAGKEVPVIIISALDTNEDKLRMYGAGVVDYLIKPISKDELIFKIEEALRSRQFGA